MKIVKIKAVLDVKLKTVTVLFLAKKQRKTQITLRSFFSFEIIEAMVQ